MKAPVAADVLRVLEDLRSAGDHPRLVREPSSRRPLLVYFRAQRPTAAELARLGRGVEVVVESRDLFPSFRRLEDREWSRSKAEQLTTAIAYIRVMEDARARNTGLPATFERLLTRSERHTIDHTLKDRRPEETRYEAIWARAERLVREEPLEAVLLARLCENVLERLPRDEQVLTILVRNRCGEFEQTFIVEKNWAGITTRVFRL